MFRKTEIVPLCSDITGTARTRRCSGAATISRAETRALSRAGRAYSLGSTLLSAGLSRSIPAIASSTICPRVGLLRLRLEVRPASFWWNPEDALSPARDRIAAQCGAPVDLQTPKSPRHTRGVDWRAECGCGDDGAE